MELTKKDIDIILSNFGVKAGEPVGTILLHGGEMFKGAAAHAANLVDRLLRARKEAK